MSGVPSIHSDWCVCIPEPLSPKIGFGMNVTDLPCAAGHVLHDVLVGHDLIGHAGERREAEIDLALTAGGDLVMMELARDADPLERQHHLRTEVVERVRGRGRKVALLRPRGVPETRLAGVPVALRGIDEVVEWFGARS